LTGRFAQAANAITVSKAKTRTIANAAPNGQFLEAPN
jgi:hypothetical protein